MTQIAQLGFLPSRLLIKPCFRVRSGCVRVVTARLTVKISSPLGPVVFVFTAKAFLPRPSLDQRAIHREVLVRHPPRRLLFPMSEKLLRQILIQQPIAVLAE